MGRVRRKSDFLWTTVTITGFEVEGLDLKATAHWSEEASAWMVESTMQVSSERITLRYDDGLAGWMAGLLGSFKTLSSEMVDEHVQNILGTSMDEYSESHFNQIVLKQVYVFLVIDLCVALFAGHII